MKPPTTVAPLLLLLAMLGLLTGTLKPVAAGTRWPATLYCVANINRGTVAGPYATPEEAVAELNQRPGGPKNRQMVCKVGGQSYWMADPRSFTLGGQQRQDGSVGDDGLQDWWYGWNDIQMMKHMCEADCYGADFRPEQWRCRGKVEYGANYKGEVLANVEAQSSAECCAACDFHSTCNTWNFCGNRQGCGDNGRFKYGFCNLKVQREKDYRHNPGFWSRGKPWDGWVSGVMSSSDPVRNLDEDSSATRRPGPEAGDEHGPWYCAVDKEQDKVLGPYSSVDTARQAMKADSTSRNWLVRSYSPFIPKMVCEMTPCGAKADPRDVNEWMSSSEALLWNNWDNVLDMNHMCEARCDEPPKQRPPWYCVSAQGSNSVWGPFSNIGHAKNEVWKASPGTRNICEVTQEDGHAVVDPNPRRDIGLKRDGRGYWGYWKAVRNMHNKCIQNYDCSQGPSPSK